MPLPQVVQLSTITVLSVAVWGVKCPSPPPVVVAPWIVKFVLPAGTLSVSEDVQLQGDPVEEIVKVVVVFVTEAQAVFTSARLQVAVVI
jgi:hypothetical protein